MAVALAKGGGAMNRMLKIIIAIIVFLAIVTSFVKVI
jgi:hypothetical protein